MSQSSPTFSTSVENFVALVAGHCASMKYDSYYTVDVILSTEVVFFAID